MATQGNPRPPFHSAKYVLAHDEKVIGAVDVVGLQAAWKAKQAKERDIPDLSVLGMDPEAKRWLDKWGSSIMSANDYRDLVIEDRKAERWYTVRRCWIQNPMGDVLRVIINGIELEEERPFYWPV